MDTIAKLFGKLFSLPKPPAYDLGARLGLKLAHRDMMEDIETTDSEVTDSES